MATSSATKIQNIAINKEAIRKAIVKKGVRCDASIPFSEYATRINQIQTLVIDESVPDTEFSYFYSPQYRNAKYSFYYAPLTGLDQKLLTKLYSLGIEQATDAQYMFSNCSNLSTISNFNLNLPLVTNTSYMFQADSNLTDISELTITAPLCTNTQSMFNNCSKLSSVSANLFIGDSGKVLDATSMFSGCYNITSADLTSLSASCVRGQSMFNNCYRLREVHLPAMSWYSYNMFAYCSMNKQIAEEVISSFVSTDPSYSYPYISSLFYYCYWWSDANYEIWRASSELNNICNSNSYSSCPYQGHIQGISEDINLNLPGNYTGTSGSLSSMFGARNYTYYYQPQRVPYKIVSDGNTLWEVEKPSTLKKVYSRAISNSGIKELTDYYLNNYIYYFKQYTPTTISFTTENAVNCDSMFSREANNPSTSTWYNPILTSSSGAYEDERSCSTGSISLTQLDTSKLASLGIEDLGKVNASLYYWSPYSSSSYGGYWRIWSPLHIKNLYVPNTKSFYYLFRGRWDLLAIDSITAGTSYTSLEQAFCECCNLESIPAFETSSVNNMNYAFYNCWSLKSLPALNMASVTSSTTGMCMFCYNVESVYLYNIQAPLDLSWCWKLKKGNGTGVDGGVLDIFNNLQAISTTKTLTLPGTLDSSTGSITLKNGDVVTAGEIAVATNKGWTVTATLRS